MLQTAYITKVSKFLPNKPVFNDEMEEYVGYINGRPSKCKNLVLRHNGIKCRYYAMEKGGKSTHSNVDLTVEAIKKLGGEDFNINDIQLLTCGSASPDYMMPSHSSMVHGKLGIGAIDVMTATGSCNSAMWAFNYAWMSVITGKISNAVCTGSEKLAGWMLGKSFDYESEYLEKIGKNPYVAFEKEFLRWMLSDGAAAILLQNKPASKGISLRIDWIEIKSYANIAKTCMYAGGVRDEEGDLIPWRILEPNRLWEETVFSLKQDSRLLEKHITELGGVFLRELFDKYELQSEKINYFLPHMSSEFFKQKIKDSMVASHVDIDYSKWFTNLDRVGNVGAASAFLMLEELFYSGKLKKDDTLLILIPESARFSYTVFHLTVV